MALKVAVIGLAESSHHLAPWGDSEWQKWCLAWDSRRFEADRAFEMHDWPLLVAYESRQYIDRLSELDQVVMFDAYAQVRKSVAYPFDAVAKTIGGDYFCSSIAYMVALAIHEGAEEIGIWGVDMDAGEEYAYQRANMEYLIGLARGKGIKVTIPDVSPLCKFQSNFAYGGTYGKS